MSASKRGLPRSDFHVGSMRNHAFETKWGSASTFPSWSADANSVVYTSYRYRNRPWLFIVARGFARIFLQNAINLGLAIVTAPDLEAVDDGWYIDDVRVDEATLMRVSRRATVAWGIVQIAVKPAVLVSRMSSSSRVVWLSCSFVSSQLSESSAM